MLDTAKPVARPRSLPTHSLHLSETERLFCREGLLIDEWNALNDAAKDLSPTDGYRRVIDARKKEIDAEVAAISDLVPQRTPETVREMRLMLEHLESLASSTDKHGWESRLDQIGYISDAVRKTLPDVPSLDHNEHGFVMSQETKSILDAIAKAKDGSATEAPHAKKQTVRVLDGFCDYVTTVSFDDIGRRPRADDLVCDDRHMWRLDAPCEANGLRLVIARLWIENYGDESVQHKPATERCISVRRESHIISDTSTDDKYVQHIVETARYRDWGRKPRIGDKVFVNGAITQLTEIPEECGQLRLVIGEMRVNARKPTKVAA